MFILQDTIFFFLTFGFLHVSAIGDPFIKELYLLSIYSWRIWRRSPTPSSPSTWGKRGVWKNPNKSQPGERWPFPHSFWTSSSMALVMTWEFDPILHREVHWRQCPRWNVPFCFDTQCPGGWLFNIEFHVISGSSFNGKEIGIELQRLFSGANECLSILPWSHWHGERIYLMKSLHFIMQCLRWDLHSTPTFW